MTRKGHGSSVVLLSLPGPACYGMLARLAVEYRPGITWNPGPACCGICNTAMHGTSQPLLEGKFDVVKIDVGNFDKNLDLAKRYGNPIEKGIPAVVVLSADSHVIYSTKGGELANARADST